MTTLYIYSNDGEQIGHVDVDPKDGYIAHLIVNKYHRGDGKGLELMSKAENEIKKAGVDVARLIPEEAPHNGKLINWYKKQGYD